MEKCFADNGRECDALTFKKCTGCAFYKTQEQLDIERSNSIRRFKKMGIYKACKERYRL